jgi:hypothetical protein
VRLFIGSIIILARENKERERETLSLALDNSS